MHVSNKLAESLLNNSTKDFWSEIKKLGGKKLSLTNRIDSSVGQEAVAETFRNKYEMLYNSVSYDTNSMESLKNRIDTLTSSICCSHNTHKHDINVSDIEQALLSLKRNKSDGYLGHNTNHIIHGSHKLFVYISLLFTSMIRHGYCPEDFLLCTVVPIPKCASKSINDSSNYRAIAISSVLGKLFDVIILKAYSDVFHTSDNQFGFKPGVSTTQCSFAVIQL